MFNICQMEMGMQLLGEIAHRWGITQPWRRPALLCYNLNLCEFTIAGDFFSNTFLK